MPCQVCKDTLTKDEQGHPMCGKCWLDMEKALEDMGAISPAK